MGKSYSTEGDDTVSLEDILDVPRLKYQVLPSHAVVVSELMYFNSSLRHSVFPSVPVWSDIRKAASLLVREETSALVKPVNHTTCCTFIEVLFCQNCVNYKYVFFLTEVLASIDITLEFLSCYKVK